MRCSLTAGGVCTFYARRGNVTAEPPPPSSSSPPGHLAQDYAQQYPFYATAVTSTTAFRGPAVPLSPSPSLPRYVRRFRSRLVHPAVYSCFTACSPRLLAIPPFASLSLSSGLPPPRSTPFVDSFEGACPTVDAFLSRKPRAFVWEYLDNFFLPPAPSRAKNRTSSTTKQEAKLQPFVGTEQEPLAPQGSLAVIYHASLYRTLSRIGRAALHSHSDLSILSHPLAHLHP